MGLLRTGHWGHLSFIGTLGVRAELMACNHNKLNAQCCAERSGGIKGNNMPFSKDD